MLYLSTPSTQPENLLAALFVVPYFWGHFGLLAVLLSLPFLLLILTFKQSRFLKWVFALYIAFLQTLLLIDTFVYQQYRFHINLFVLDLFFNGQGQIISFAWYLWTAVFGFMAVLWAFEVWLSNKLEQRASSENFKISSWVLGTLFACFIASHLIHVFADGYFYRPITKLGTIPPLAVPLNAQETLAKYGLVDVEKYKSKSLLSLEDEKKSTVNYPTEELKCGAPEKLNILFILLDSTRADMLNPTVMPNAFALSKKSTVFDEHFSGSNSTRGGVFGLFYGLPPLYFDKFKETHTPPVLMDEVLQNHFEIEILGSAPLTKPEFDQTIFGKIENLRKKSKAGPALKRDLEITDEWLHFTKNRDTRKPFFGFLFYDSPHEFSYDPDDTPFTPYLKEINYFALNNSTDPMMFLNRYKNSVYYTDTLLGRVISDLKIRGLMENTIIVLTADHGQEFNDNKLNYWGHNSNFTDAQTRVPFFIYWPGQHRPTQERVIKHWTDHYDVAPTLMEELFHCQNQAATYSSGENLFTGAGHDWILHGTYGDFGIRLKDHFIVIKTTGSYEVVDLHYRPIDNEKVDYATYEKALREMRRFFK
jgi:membrane-anchored protein YejM (alkaline phosphatase superfamily)